MLLQEVPFMPITRPPYSPEFRQQVIDLARAGRENKQLRVERDILSRAAAWFARETGAVSSGSSGS